MSGDTKVALPPDMRPLRQQEMDDSERDSYQTHATEYALDYYLAGRFANAHHCIPVSADILHHAAELLLKRYLSRRHPLKQIQDYRNTH